MQHLKISKSSNSKIPLNRFCTQEIKQIVKHCLWTGRHEDMFVGPLQKNKSIFTYISLGFDIETGVGHLF